MESPILRQIACTDARSLEQAYLHLADAPWVEGCTVDLPNLLLEVRARAPWGVRGSIEAQLALVEDVARRARS